MFLKYDAYCKELHTKNWGLSRLVLFFLKEIRTLKKQNPARSKSQKILNKGRVTDRNSQIRVELVTEN